MFVRLEGLSILERKGGHMNPLMAFESEGSFGMGNLVKPEVCRVLNPSLVGLKRHSQTHQHSPMWLAQQGSQMPTRWLGWWCQDSFFFLCPKIQNEITLPFPFFVPPCFVSSCRQALSIYSFPAATKMNKATYFKAVCWPLGLRSLPQQKGSSSEMNVDPWSTSGMQRKTNDWALSNSQHPAGRKAAIWDFKVSGSLTR